MNQAPSPEQLPADDSTAVAAELAAHITTLAVQLRRDMYAAGLSLTQARVLVALQEGGSARITELADRERVTQPSMTSLITRMERAGYVLRRPDPDDQRAVRVVATELGLDLLSRIAAARDASLASALSALSTSDVEALRTMLPALARLTDAHRTGEGLTDDVLN